MSPTPEQMLRAAEPEKPAPIPMLLWCPECGMRHIDRGTFATKPHHTHACQGCGHVWRPAVVPTCGVQFLPGYKDEES
jgi:rubredoxin